MNATEPSWIMISLCVLPMFFHWKSIYSTQTKHGIPIFTSTRQDKQSGWTTIMMCGTVGALSKWEQVCEKSPSSIRVHSCEYLRKILAGEKKETDEQMLAASVSHFSSQSVSYSVIRVCICCSLNIGVCVRRYLIVPIRSGQMCCEWESCRISRQWAKNRSVCFDRSYISFHSARLLEIGRLGQVFWQLLHVRNAARKVHSVNFMWAEINVEFC